MLKHYGFIVQFILLFGCTTSQSMEDYHKTYTSTEISTGNNNNSTLNNIKEYFRNNEVTNNNNMTNNNTTHSKNNYIYKNNFDDNERKNSGVNTQVMNWFGNKTKKDISQLSKYNNNLSIHVYNDLLRKIGQLKSTIDSMKKTTKDINPPLQIGNSDNSSTVTNTDKEGTINNLKEQNKCYYNIILQLTSKLQELDNKIKQLENANKELSISNFAYAESYTQEMNNSKRLLSLLRRERSKSSSNSFNNFSLKFNNNNTKYNNNTNNIRPLNRTYSTNNLLITNNNKSRNKSVKPVFKNEPEITYSEMLKPQIEEMKQQLENKDTNKNTSQVKNNTQNYPEVKEGNALDILNNRITTGKDTNETTMTNKGKNKSGCFLYPTLQNKKTKKRKKKNDNINIQIITNKQDSNNISEDKKDNNINIINNNLVENDNTESNIFTEDKNNINGNTNNIEEDKKSINVINDEDIKIEEQNKIEDDTNNLLNNNNIEEDKKSTNQIHEQEDEKIENPTKFGTNDKNSIIENKNINIINNNDNEEYNINDYIYNDNEEYENEINTTMNNDQVDFLRDNLKKEQSGAKNTNNIMNIQKCKNIALSSIDEMTNDSRTVTVFDSTMSRSQLKRQKLKEKKKKENDKLDKLLMDFGVDPNKKIEHDELVGKEWNRKIANDEYLLRIEELKEDNKVNDNVIKKGNDKQNSENNDNNNEEIKKLIKEKNELKTIGNYEYDIKEFPNNKNQFVKIQSCSLNDISKKINEIKQLQDTSQQDITPCDLFNKVNNYVDIYKKCKINAYNLKVHSIKQKNLKKELRLISLLPQTNNNIGNLYFCCIRNKVNIELTANANCDIWKCLINELYFNIFKNKLFKKDTSLLDKYKSLWNKSPVNFLTNSLEEFFKPITKYIANINSIFEIKKDCKENKLENILYNICIYFCDIIGTSSIIMYVKSNHHSKSVIPTSSPIMKTLSTMKEVFTDAFTLIINSVKKCIENNSDIQTLKQEIVMHYPDIEKMLINNYYEFTDLMEFISKRDYSVKMRPELYNRFCQEVMNNKTTDIRELKTIIHNVLND